MSANSTKEEKILYCDCFSGISGDMFLGALIDLGASFYDIVECVKSLPIEPFEMRISKEKRGSLWGTKVTIEIPSSPKKHRTFEEIKNLIEGSNLPHWVKTQSIRVFEIIAQAEAKVHNEDPRSVHFHEIGAIDSIIDIVGTVAGLYLLDITSLESSPLPIGRGFIKTQHGLIPNPAPATLWILEGIPIYGVDSPIELVTPTGAALLKALATRFGKMPEFILEGVGYGVGTYKEDHPPNVLRVMVGKKLETSTVEEELVVVETNIDNMPQEFYEYIMERLFQAGALDVWLTPIVMKKSRPSVKLSALVPPSLRFPIENIIFVETTTAGIRSYKVSRRSLKRYEKKVNTPWQEVTVKVFKKPDGTERIMPEYEECKKIAHQHKVPLLEVYKYLTAMECKDA